MMNTHSERRSLMDITTLTMEQLKALAYDQIVILNQAQANLNTIQAEIAKREQAAKEPVK
jgi:hypothetical protein